jgi:hypothetical protein
MTLKIKSNFKLIPVFELYLKLSHRYLSSQSGTNYKRSFANLIALSISGSVAISGTT